MNSLYQVDELVKEYLLFRGFTATFRALESEIRSDKGFQVDKIIEELLGAIVNGDIQALIDYYRYLDQRFFSRLDSRFQRTIKKFELCLLRHYLIHAMQHKKKDKVIEFFDVYGPELHGKPEWSQWFALPYIKNPSNDPTFETFFSKQWADNYTISLHNFLAMTFQNMPLPTLLSFSIDRNQRKTQQTEIENLKTTVENQKATLETRENDIAKLKHEVTETRKEMTDGISLIRRKVASSSTSIADQKQKKPEKDNSSSSSNTTPVPERSNSKSTRKSDKSVASNNSKQDQTITTENITEDITESVVESNTIRDTKVEEEEPFLVVNQEEFSEHASEITHAKFSSQGDLIASCDLDNIVRIWSHKDQSFNTHKIKNNSSNILSLEWDARSDRFLYLGTDTGLIRVYNVESKSVVQEFLMDEDCPWVTQLSSSPTEPIFVCAGSSNRLSKGVKSSSALVAWSMKTMSACGTFHFKNDKESESSINTIQLNHNGQMLITGDSEGLLRIFDIRSMKSITEWAAEPSCMAQFSFDENSIYSVDRNGSLSQWSIHKPGVCTFKYSLDGFSAAPKVSNTAKTPTNISIALPKASSSSSSSASKKHLATANTAHSILSTFPRSQMVAFSSDTDYVLCPATDENADSNDNSASTFGSVYRVATHEQGNSILKFGSQPSTQNITAVDWTNSSNACLLGSADGNVKVTDLIKVN